MKKILIVEDSPEAFALINLALKDCGKLTWAKDIKSTLELIELHVFDLIVLDLILTDGDGVSLCSLLQTDERFRNIPIIVLSSRQAVADQLVAFAVGADDYVRKPFHPEELRARVQAKLRKKEIKDAESFSTHVGDLTLDHSARTVHAASGDAKHLIHLTSLEFKLLSFLCKNKNEVLSRDRILDSVWGSDCHVYSRNIDTHISKIKKKMGEYSSYIQSRHGEGYILKVPDVERFPAASEMLKNVSPESRSVYHAQEASSAPRPMSREIAAESESKRIELPFNVSVSAAYEGSRGR